MTASIVAPKKHARHGLTTTPEYYVWSAMIQRCRNPNSPPYKNYGGRGITICDQWIESFPQFLSDMGERPSPLHSLDRIDNDSGYRPDNCRWASARIQVRNRRGWSKSGIKGVRQAKYGWQAQLYTKGKHIHLGTFKDIEQAAEARRQAEIKYWHGEEEADT